MNEEFEEERKQMKKIIDTALKNLGKRNIIYHSEAELQFKLAWELYRNASISDIYFEYPAKNMPSGNRYNDMIDLVIVSKGKEYPIEIKYPKGVYRDSTYNLKYKPVDECYEIVRDIDRIEQYVGNNISSDKGYVIVLSNNTSYWGTPKPHALLSLTMYMTDNTTLNSGIHIFKPGSKRFKDTKCNQHILNNYNIKWEPYCVKKTTLSNNKNVFKYLLLEVV